MSFSMDVSRFIEKANGRMDRVVKKIAMDLFAAVIKATPVGNPTLWKNPPPKGYHGGTARGNWQCSRIDPYYRIKAINDESGDATITEMMATVNGYKKGEPLYLMNSLPYIQRLEDGWSRQAPYGMVKQQISRFEGVTRDAANEENQ